MSSRSGRGKRKLRSGIGDGFEEWGGYMPAKIQKLQDQFQELSDESPTGCQLSHIFAGIAIFVNGYTRPPSSELRKLMMRHGGTYHHYYQRPVVTHIIASNLPNNKVLNLTDKKVVKPEWITDSIKAEKLLSHEPYLLYTSRGKSQPGLDKFTVKSSAEVNSLVSVPTDEATTQRNPNAFESMTSLSDPAQSGRLLTSDACAIVDAAAACTANSGLVPITGSTLQPPGAPLPSIERMRNKAGGNGTIADARDPKFLAEFFSNSRLHHISTWGAELKALVGQLQTAGDRSFPGRAGLRLEAESRATRAGDVTMGRSLRVIMHVDMDCFFVSVGLRKRPDLIGKPVAVTHSRGKGVKRDRPGTDLSYEVAHYSKRGLKLRKGPGRGTLDPKLGTEHNPEQNLQLAQIEEMPDEGFMDEEEQGSETGNSCLDPARDVTKETCTSHVMATTTSNPTTEVFQSMAEIASCNYEARKAGVRNGMFMGQARSLCPDIQTIPYDFEGYREVSQLLYGEVARFTYDIEAVSCDEMLVDCSDLLSDTGATPEEFATLLRKSIREKTGCNASAGLGPNILLARMAIRVAKPNGQFFLSEDAATDFMKDKLVSDLPGVGRAMVNRLSAMQITTCTDLQKLSLGVLQRELGTKTGQALFRFSRGEDSRQIKSEQQRKSVSAEVNYGIRFKNETDVSRFISELSGEVHTRLAKIHVKGKTITLKLKVRAEGAPKETAKFMGHGICDNVTKSATIPMPTDNPDVISKEVMGIIHALRIPPSEYRGVGIQVSRLEAPVHRKSLSGRHQSILSFTTKPTRLSASESSTPSTSSHKSTTNIPTSCIATGDPVVSVSAIPQAPSLETFTISTSGDIGIHRTAPDRSVAASVSAGQTTSNRKAVRKKTDKAGGLFLEIHPSERGSQQPSADGNRVSGDVEQLDDHRLHNIGPRVKITLPPLPTLPDFRSPPSNDMWPNASDTVNLLLPSPSQVDMDVLMELPADIREQIEREMAAQRAKGQARVDTTRSQAEATTTASTVASRTPQNDEPIVALPSLSQLDPSCLVALPAELRAELAEAYKRETECKPNTRSVPVADLQLHPLMQPKNQQHSPKGNSPKKHSPGRASRGSPHFKRPRGRGRGRGRQGPGRPRRELDFGKSGGRANASGSSIDKKVPNNAVLTSADAASPGASLVSIPSTSSHNGYSDSVPSTSGHSRFSGSIASTSGHTGFANHSRVAPEGVSLCGAVTLSEVKDLLSQWSASCDVPEADDVGHVTKYLYNLVEDHDLEKVDLVLKYFRRCVGRLQNSTQWDQVYSEVVSQAQAIVQATYGSRLKI